ncbi:MAG: molecular chaperone DnaJ [Promethearchaeota archaeon]
MSSSKKRDYYEVLGIGKNASSAEITRAFRKLAKKYHPDMNPDDKDSEEKFKEANEAYSILSDKEKRARYDQFGFAGVDSQGGFGGSGGGFGFEDIFGDTGFGDLFGSIFGGRRGQGRRRKRRGSDLRMSLPLSFKEAVFGVKKEISVKRRVPCDDCRGTGAAPGSTPVRCPTCGGNGQVTQTRRTPFGIVQQITECPNCNGDGKIIKEECKTCRGTGIVTDIDKIKITIPPGIPDDDVVIPLRGKGNIESRGAIPGDLYLILDIKPHQVFIREGANLLRDLYVDYLQLVFGDTEVPVMTLEGTLIRIKIPPGTKPGTPFRVRGKGVPIFRDARDRRGDLYITVYCDVPDIKKMEKEQKELLKNLSKLRMKDIRAKQLQKEENLLEGKERVN